MTERNDIVYQLREEVAWLTLNNPRSANALDVSMMEILVDLLQTITVDPRVRCVVVTGSGSTFCAGADLASSSGALRDSGPRILSLAGSIVSTIVHAPVPVIVGMNGPAIGFGASIAFASDIILAVDAAYFSFPYTKVGLMPDGGASVTVAAALGRTRAMRMLMTSEKLQAVDAFNLGLVAEVCDVDSLHDAVESCASVLSSGARTALRLSKQVVNAATLSRLPLLLAQENDGQIGLHSTKDFAEGVRAFSEGRPPDFSGM